MNSGENLDKLRYWRQAHRWMKLRRFGAVMVIISFPDKATQNLGLGFLLGRFSGRALRGGILIVPEAAVEALAAKGIAFSVKGKATYAQQVAVVRNSVSPPVQRRQRRASRIAG
jgi:hypothetical protein